MISAQLDNAFHNPEESLKLNKKEHFSSPIGRHSIIAHKPSERRTETEAKSAVSVLLPTGLSLSWCLQNNITFKHDNAITICVHMRCYYVGQIIETDKSEYMESWSRYH